MLWTERQATMIANTPVKWGPPDSAETTMLTVPVLMRLDEACNALEVPEVGWKEIWHGKIFKHYLRKDDA